MKITIDAIYAKHMMKDYDRDYFTTTALEAILDYYDEVDENTEFDPIGICCDWNEYGNGAALDVNDLINDYGYLVDDLDEMDEDEQTDAIINALEENTLVMQLDNGNYLIQVF